MTGRIPAFESIHDAYRPRIRRYLGRMVGEAEAEDLTQQVMLKVNANLPRFRGEADLSTWIYRIATNTALDQLRRRRTREEPPPAGMAAPRADEQDEAWAEASVPSAEAGAIREEMNQCVRDFVDRLPDGYKSVIALSELEGFTNSEIAAILGISIDTVKIRLHRARERLRKDLASGCSFHRDDRNEFACERKP